MPRSKLLVLAGCYLLAAAVPAAGVLADDDAEDSATYEVDFFNYAGDGGTVSLDGDVVCTLAMKQYCSHTLQKDSGRHTAVFHAAAGYQVSESFDASTCGDVPAINFDIYDDHVEISCNGWAF